MIAINNPPIQQMPISSSAAPRSKIPPSTTPVLPSTSSNVWNEPLATLRHSNGDTGAVGSAIAVSTLSPRFYLGTDFGILDLRDATGTARRVPGIRG